MINQGVSIKKLTQIKQRASLLKMNSKCWAHLIQAILEVKINFEEGGTQNYLVFQPKSRYFERVSRVGTSNYIHFRKYIGLSNENITAPTTSDYNKWL